MGTLRYGPNAYDLPNNVLATLEDATWGAFIKGQSFPVEITTSDMTITLMFSPGVPIVFELDTVFVENLGGSAAGTWSERAEMGNVIEIRLDD